MTTTAFPYPIRWHQISHTYAEDHTETLDRESFVYITKEGGIEGWRLRPKLLKPKSGGRGNMAGGAQRSKVVGGCRRLRWSVGQAAGEVGRRSGLARAPILALCVVVRVLRLVVVVLKDGLEHVHWGAGGSGGAVPSSTPAPKMEARKLSASGISPATASSSSMNA